MDWFRLAQTPTRNWIKIICNVLPRSRLSAKQILRINNWKVGDPVIKWEPQPKVPCALIKKVSNTLECPACPFVADNTRALQVHYDGQHAVQQAGVTTMLVARCKHCGKPFVHKRDLLRHRCHKTTYLRGASCNHAPGGLSACGCSFARHCPLEAVHGWGRTCATERAVCRVGSCNLGGVFVVVYSGRGSFWPVCVAPSEDRWTGAESATNNVGELTAMIEALLWLEAEAPGPPEVPATIYRDSTYTFTAITGRATPKENIVLVQKAREILNRIQIVPPIDFIFVKGHSGNLGNHHADRLAGQGAKGIQSTQSSRWRRPLGAPLPICGRVFSGSSYARQLAGHEAHCKVPGASPAHILCRNNCGRSFPWKFTDTPGKHNIIKPVKLETYTKKSVGVRTNSHASVRIV